MSVARNGAGGIRRSFRILRVVLGYEGAITLDLAEREGRVSGACTATISDHHEPFVRSGKVSGEADDGRLSLRISFARADVWGSRMPCMPLTSGDR
jgi:hypothetical protein